MNRYHSPASTPLAEQRSSRQPFEWVLLAFFGLAALALIILYLVDPSVYASTLLIAPSGTDRYPLPATLFLVALLLFLAVLMRGVLRHWRWLFWLLLIAFGSSLLEIPAILFQLAGWLPAFPGPFPLWYNLSRIGAALLEVGMAAWMLAIYRRAGIWGEKRGREP